MSISASPPPRWSPRPGDWSDDRRTLLPLSGLALPAMAQTHRTEEAHARGRGVGYCQATWHAWGERDAHGRVLNAMGWCYGRRSEIGAAMNWHRCEANSNRPCGA